MATSIQNRTSSGQLAEANAKAKASVQAGGKKNDFHNFKQHDYDFDAIERALDAAT